MLFQKSLYESMLFSCCFLVGEISVCLLCKVVLKHILERGVFVVGGLAGILNNAVGFEFCLPSLLRGHMVEQALLRWSPSAFHVRGRNSSVIFFSTAGFRRQNADRPYSWCPRVWLSQGTTDLLLAGSVFA